MPTKFSSRGLALRVVVALLLLTSLAGVAISIGVHSATASGSHPATAGGSHPAIASGSHVATADGSSTGAAIVNYAASQAGVPYCDGGGGIHGPSVGGSGSTCGSGVVGFDCMSVAQYAVYQATGFAIDSDDKNGVADNIYSGPDYNSNGSMGTFVPSMTTVAEDEAALSPGEVVLFGGYNPSSYAHSGIWAGNDQIWDASGSPGSVRTVSFEYLMSTYGNAYQGAMDYNAFSQTTPPKPSIATTSLPVATIGKRYKGGQLTATGGTTPYRWTVAGLPKGLKVSTRTGLITGTVRNSKKHPQAPGSYPVKVTVTDGASQQATASLTLTLDAAS